MGLHRRCNGVRTETEVLTVRYNILGKIMVREAPLQAERLQPGHRSANSQVEEYACFNGVDLCHVKRNWMLGSIVDLSVHDAGLGVEETRRHITHWGMMALKRARVTTMLGFAFIHSFIISHPICSPSLSQSVQIMSLWAFRASFLRFWAIEAASFLTSAMMGASKRSNGSQEVHFEYWKLKSCSSI